MAEKINIDALIPREDLENNNISHTGRRKDTVSISDLCYDSFLFLNLHKPDFQRETTEWDYKKISSFIETFINNELIPAIILWQSSGGNIFVIDGAHRLSSLIAWINDDYGDGKITREAYAGNIPDDQIVLAKKCREYVNKNVGAYSSYKEAIQHKQFSTAEFEQKARFLTNAAIQLQWVEGDVSSAEKSFFNINQKAAPINPTEIELIKLRRNSFGIAARAIMRKGTGHKYWENFDTDKQQEIEELSKELYELMFEPRLNNPIKTVDVPMCGKHKASSLSLIFEFIKICNRDSMFLEVDDTGDDTISCLKQTRKIARLINSNHPSSLGLHPLIYFYANNGSYRISAFYAFTLFVKKLDSKNKKNVFIKHRMQFEQVFYANSSLLQVIARKNRSALAGMKSICSFLFEILHQFELNTEFNNVIAEIKKLKEFSYLPDVSIGWVLYTDPPKNFSSEMKSKLYIREALSHVLRCKICCGALHRNAMSIDHIRRKEDGGNADIQNGQLTHPYCNTGYKN